MTASVTSGRAELTRRLTQVRAQLATARRARDEAAALYASTPDGAAETYRRYELATGTNKHRLRDLYLAGLALADTEYQRRVALGNATPGDGPLQIIPVGDLNNPTARALLEHRIMGTLRNGPDLAATETARVTLLRLAPDSRTRTRTRLTITVPAPFGITTDTLTEIITTTARHPKDAARLRKFLGSTATESIHP
jgi:hypothetical protein